ncbi:hypothetical protein [Haloarcula japonica]|uniref:Uncharacterized protein n=1 Tax=Haloarcula japonica (strain ATCC 49778 / DSM 6131 / JCM 7785 / NBRC 101032 / NCIMB 13157 / TR-1) TaxID=1227453 RepID=M0LJC0_HALJT|nr:hypothetical protein [Haloarcula japonica]EMA33737.1 hypothetical protein C444_04852 [Haloarcula japonica DSM 6131]
MPDSDQVKAALTALVDGEVDSEDGDRAARVAGRDDSTAGRRVIEERGDDADDYRTVIERATQAIDDLDEAVAFVETFGVGRLEAAVAQADHEVSGLADEGRAALRAFRRYRDAAGGTDTEV